MDEGIAAEFTTEQVGVAGDAFETLAEENFQTSLDHRRGDVSMKFMPNSRAVVVDFMTSSSPTERNSAPSEGGAKRE